MIYLDSAATSYHKPAAVRHAVLRALTTMTSPGRGGYPSAMEAADTLYACRCALGDLFGVEDPANVVFTSSATHGLNIALKTLVGPGDRVVISGFEHNAVTRPLRAIGAETVVAASPLFDPDAAVEAYRRALPGAKAAVCCHVSNVFGYVLPVERIAALCREEGVPLVIDAAQSAGVLPLDMRELGAAFTAMPGHKGLLGPQGTGVLLCASDAVLPLLEGGTGSLGESEEMPEFLPDRLEAGTHNVPGIAGLLAGVSWLQRQEPGAVRTHETALRHRLANALRGRRDLRLFEAEEDACQTGVLSVVTDGLDGEEAARQLGEAGIAVRAGLHCAPLAHRSAGTFDTGTLRLSVSPFTTEREIDAAAARVIEILERSARK